MASTLLAPRIVSISDPCGCTLTRASVTPLTPERLEGMAMIEYNQERIYMAMMEARAVGVVPNVLSDILMSRVKQRGVEALHKKQVGMQSIIAPFNYRFRKRNFASSGFRIQGGVANAHAGTTFGGVVYPNSSWDLTVKLSTQGFASTLPDISRWFLVGNWVNMESQTAANVATSAHAVIVAVSAVSSGIATVTVAAPYLEADWTALSAPNKAKWNPTFGFITLLSNSVNDYESWCTNQPWQTSRELVVDWVQTMRYTRCTNAAYEEMLRLIAEGRVNGFAENFKYLEIVEFNQQTLAEFEKEFINTIFWGGRIDNVNQIDDLADANFLLLPAVTDPLDSTCVLERKANIVGIYQQLKEHSRVVDMQGLALDFDMLLPLLYTLRRHRKLDGKPHEVIDLLGDRFTKDRFDQVMIRYLRDRYAYTRTQDISAYIKPGSVTDEASGGPAFEYTVYDLPMQQLKIGFITNVYFDDRIDSFKDAGPGNGDISPRGRQLWALDFTDITIGLVATNQVERQYGNEVTAQANSALSCVMKLNPKTFVMESRTITCEIGDYNRHLLIENFSDSCITLSNYPCEPVTS